MTDTEKKQMRVLLNEQAKARARKTRARTQADPKHAMVDRYGIKIYWSQTLGRFVTIPENEGETA